MQLSEELELALDRVAFARHCGIENPDPWQEEFLSTNARRVICTAGRQTGKSACSSILALHRALYFGGSTIVVVSPSLRQSQLLFRKILDGWHRLGKPVGAETENKLSLELGNGSLIVSLPGSERTIRGFSAVDLLLLDEAAAVPDDLWQAIQPMTLISGGRLVLLSTPRGKVGRFYEIWRQRGQRGWKWFLVPVTDVERIPAEAIADQRMDMSDTEFRQELLCEFIEPSGAYFGHDEVMQAVTDEVEPLVIAGIPQTGG